MLTVDQYARIRQLRRDGRTIRQIADELNHSPKTILKALANPEPVPATRAAQRPAPVFGPFRQAVDDILAADETAPRKQRHTAQQIFRRLVAEQGYPGGYDQVRRYLQQRRRDRRDTFIPLDHPPGHRAEADFGHIHVDFPDGRRPVPVLLVTWSYSNAPFALALPTERTEAILHGLVEAFAFFGCVPAELWWDNPTTVAIHILRGRERALHPRYAALVSHYTLTPKFCLPRAATEKPRVENRVYDLERQWATPVPRVTDLGALNGHLRQCCLTARQRACGDNAETVGVRFERDRAAALAVPEHPFDDCVLHPGQVDKYQTVRFDGNAYSVPRRYAFRPVTVKGYVGRRGRRRAGDRHARAQLRPPRQGARPAAFPGAAGAQAGRPGPRAGLPRLAVAARVRSAPRRPRRATRPGGRRPPLHPRAAVARRPPRRSRRRGHRRLPPARRPRRGGHRRRGRTPRE
jgi:transposase